MQLGIIVKIRLQQNSTTQMFEFVQRILWTTVLWTYESTRLAVHKGYF